jgi:hypothetical protein
MKAQAGFGMISLLFVGALGACAQITAQPLAPTRIGGGSMTSIVGPTAVLIPPLATPVSDTPAAGICAEAQSPIAEMTMRPHVPAPRCLRVRADQRLRVVNSLETGVKISLGRESAALKAGGEYVFELPFGELVMPGVHILQASQCCAGSIWLQDE